MTISPPTTAPLNILSGIDRDRLARLVEISRTLNSATQIDDLLHFILEEAVHLTQSEATSILLLDPNTRELRFKATSAGTKPEIVDYPVPLDKSIAGAILQTNRPMVVNDVSQDPRWNPDIAKSIGFATDSILGVPMRGEEGAVGVLEAINKIDGEFDNEDVEILGILANLAGVAVEKARLIEELRQANHKLNELDRLKSDFISLAAHELRTPLSIILGYAAYLSEEVEAGAKNQVQSVLRAALKLRSLIEDMINLKYVDAGISDLESEQFSLNELVENILEDHRPTIKAKRLNLSVSKTDEPMMISGHRGMIEAAVSNLINNAVKFTPEAGDIWLNLATRHGEAWLSVRDTGIGMEPEQVQRVFERFYQVEPHMRRRYEGLGLGLAIASELAELHGGRVWASSQVGQGSEFLIALPLADEP